MKLLDFLFWFAILMVVGCCTVKPKKFVPNLSSLMDPRTYCIEHCRAVGMKGVSFVIYNEQVLCACVDEPQEVPPEQQ